MYCISCASLCRVYTILYTLSPCALPKADCLYNSVHSTNCCQPKYTYNVHVYYTCTHVHCTAQVANPSTRAHYPPASHFFPCWESESIFLVNLPFSTVMVLPPATKFSNVVHCVSCVFPPLFTSRCGHWAEKGAVKPTCHQRTTGTSGQPMGAKRVTQCSTRVPGCSTNASQCTINVPKCNQPPMFFGAATVLQKVYHQLPVWCWCDCLVYHKYCHAVPQVFQCFIATWCIAVMWVHNPPSYPLATDQLSPRCILPTFCIFSSNLRIHTFVNSPILYTVGISVHNMKVENVYNVWDALKHRVLCA